MPSSTTNIPAAYAAFLDIMTEAVPDGTQVIDGAPVEYSAPNAVALTGWRQTQAPRGLANAPSFRMEEHFELQGFVRAFRGDTDAPGARQTAFCLLEAIETQLREDPTLGRVVIASWFASNVGQQGPTDQGGWVAEIDFTVHCDALIN